MGESLLPNRGLGCHNQKSKKWNLGSQRQEMAVTLSSKLQCGAFISGPSCIVTALEADRSGFASCSVC